MIAWQKRWFCDHWRRLSQQGKLGRQVIAKEIRALIRHVSQANPMWGAPRIVGELQKLGINVAKSTVEKYRVRPKKPPLLTWKTFLNTHVRSWSPSISLWCRLSPTRCCLSCSSLLITGAASCMLTSPRTPRQSGPASKWSRRSHGMRPQHLLRDRDRVYGTAFRQRVRTLGITEGLSAPCSPWQNPYVERLIGSIRRECLEHVMVLGERHLNRILTSYLANYHHWRTHLSLEMGCPEPRPIQPSTLGLCAPCSRWVACIITTNGGRHDDR